MKQGGPTHPVIQQHVVWTGRGEKHQQEHGEEVCVTQNTSLLTSGREHGQQRSGEETLGKMSETG